MTFNDQAIVQDAERRTRAGVAQPSVQPSGGRPPIAPLFARKNAQRSSAKPAAPQGIGRHSAGFDFCRVCFRIAKHKFGSGSISRCNMPPSMRRDKFGNEEQIVLTAAATATQNIGWPNL